MWYLKFHTEYLKKMAAVCPEKCYERSVSLGIPHYEWRTRALIAAQIQWNEEKHKDPTVHLPRLIWEEELLSTSHS
jgi:hypothetical protein